MSKTAESVEVVLPSDIPPGWRRTTLGEIGEYINGRGFKKSEWSDTGLPIIRIQNLTGTGKEQNYYDGDIDERNVVNPGDLLISWAATLGAYLWAGPRAALNQHIFKVRSYVDKKFHYYLMQHILDDLYRQTHGSGMVHITKSKFDSMPIVVPETQDGQKRIVAEIEKQFSRLDEAVTNLKRVKANLKRYKAAVLKAAVEGRLVETEAELARKKTPSPLAGEGGGEEASYETGAKLLQRILETRRSQWKGKGKYKEPTAPETTDLPELPEGWVRTSVEAVGEVLLGRQRAPQYLTGRFLHPYLRVANIKDDKIDFSDLEEMDFDDNHFTKYKLEPGDILVSEGQSPELLGQSAIFRGFPFSLCFQKTLHRFRPLPYSVSPEYAQLVFRSHMYSGVFRKLGSITTNIAHLTLEKFKGAPFPLPPLAEQQRIVTEIERRFSISEQIETQLNASFKRAAGLRQAILVRAFSGKLSMRDMEYQSIGTQKSPLATATAESYSVKV